MLRLPRLALLGALLVLPAPASADEPLHARIDRLVLAGARGLPLSPAAPDGEFLRRVYLDLAGTIPTTAQTRAFLADGAADKRARLIDSLLAAPTYPRAMQERFHVLLMERLGDHPDWA